MTPRVTRRQLAAALALPAVLLSQAPPISLPGNAGEELQAARDQLRQNGEALAKVQVPMTAEPAVHFKA